MHEYSIVQSLLESCEEHARTNDAKKVTKVVVKIGVLSGVEPDLLQTAFDTFKEQLDAEKIKVLEATTNVGNVIIAVIALVVNIIVAVLAFKNLSKIKDNAPSLSPYRIALIYTVVYNLASFALTVYLNIPLSPFNIVLPLVFLGLYSYVYNKAAQLLDKEDDETDSESVNQ